MKRLRDERGSVLVLVAASLLLFLVLAALVVDIGMARQVARNYQNAADGGALAGAQGLPSAPTPVDTAARYAFQTLALQDPYAAVTCPAGGEVPSASSFCYQSGTTGPMVYVTTPWNDVPADGMILPETHQVNVKICGNVHAGFFSFLRKVDFLFRPCRLATAMSAPRTGPCALCVRNGGLNVSGSGTATVTGSSAWINSSATNSGGPTAFSAQDGFYVGGSASGFTPPPDATGAPKISDPAAWLPTPMERQPNWVPPYLPWGGKFTFDGTPKGAKSQFVDPGIYTSIVVDSGDSSQTLTLNPGSYVIREKFEISSDVNVVALGVTIYFACKGRYEAPLYQLCSSSGNDIGAYFRHTGGGTVTFSATSSPGDPYHNLLFFFDRNNHAQQQFSGGSANVKGTIYAPGADVVLGNGTFNSLFVVESMQLSTNGLLRIIYNPDEQVPTYLPALIR
jgi:putative Flp pilus-assembly TadE/G-like protein